MNQRKGLPLSSFSKNSCTNCAASDMAFCKLSLTTIWSKQDATLISVSALAILVARVSALSVDRHSRRFLSSSIEGGIIKMASAAFPNCAFNLSPPLTSTSKINYMIFIPDTLYFRTQGSIVTSWINLFPLHKVSSLNFFWNF